MYCVRCLTLTVRDINGGLYGQKREPLICHACLGRSCCSVGHVWKCAVTLMIKLAVTSVSDSRRLAQVVAFLIYVYIRYTISSPITVPARSKA
jgi:hypothetical protein